MDGFEFASCWVPTGEDHPTQLVTPYTSPIEIRGGGNATRQINGIIPSGFDCHRIAVLVRRERQKLADGLGSVLPANPRGAR